MDPSKYTGWLTLIGGAASIFLQIWNALHGSPVEAQHALVSAALCTSGVAHLNGGHR